jgi:hypothetical protein
MTFDVERSRLFIVLSFELIGCRCVGPALKPCTIYVEPGAEVLRMLPRQQLGASGVWDGGMREKNNQPGCSCSRKRHCELRGSYVHFSVMGGCLLCAGAMPIFW